MRRCSAKDRRQARRRGFCLLAVLVLTAGVLSLNRYVNTVVKPTLHELAEYEARSAAVQAMNRAVAAELTRSPALCVSAGQTEMDALPEICYAVPFGSLTNNSLLSGLGPGWLLSIQPKGYVQGEIRETTQSLSINTTRYSAVLQLSVTVNMILDGSTATLTVAADYPLASLLVCGDIPNAYASDFD